MTLKFKNDFEIQPSSESGGGGTTPVFNGTYKENSGRFKVFKNTVYSVGSSSSTGIKAGVKLDLNSVTLPDTITSAAFILKIRPINQAGSSNAILMNYDTTAQNGRLKIQLNGSTNKFALYERTSGSNNVTTDNYGVTYAALGTNAYWAALVFDGTKNYGYIIQDTNDSNPIEKSFCNIPLTDSGWHKTTGFVGEGKDGSFLKSDYEYYIATGADLETTTTQTFSGIIHLDSVELQINGQRVWQLIK